MPHPEKSQLSDEEVVQQVIANKDTALFGLLYDRYADKVFAKCVSFAHDRQQAEDLAHDVFLKVYLKLGEFRFEAKFSTWLYSVTYHECVEYVRKRKKTSKDQEEYGAEQEYAESADSEVAMLELKIEQLKQLLEKISPEEKALLLMKYQDGLSIEELMEHTQLGESAVKMRLKRTREKVVALSRTLTIISIMIAIYWLFIVLQ
uniref:RNA polymerase sigma factor n=1 Tax=Roseihalotalea indica TaxID=2867963 RepID=A0AA49GTJ0_9BACT|nr:RNA polymerase sigma factor [Tunicatimonas sp. TK19036]